MALKKQQQQRRNKYSFYNEKNTTLIILCRTAVIVGHLMSERLWNWCNKYVLLTLHWIDYLVHVSPFVLRLVQYLLIFFVIFFATVKRCVKGGHSIWLSCMTAKGGRRNGQRGGWCVGADNVERRPRKMSLKFYSSSATRMRQQLNKPQRNTQKVESKRNGINQDDVRIFGNDALFKATNKQAKMSCSKQPTKLRSAKMPCSKQPTNSYVRQRCLIQSNQQTVMFGKDVLFKATNKQLGKDALFKATNKQLCSARMPCSKRPANRPKTHKRWKTTIFNWTKQDKTYKFSRLSSFSSYVQHTKQTTVNRTLAVNSVTDFFQPANSYVRQGCLVQGNQQTFMLQENESKLRGLCQLCTWPGLLKCAVTALMTLLPLSLSPHPHPPSTFFSWRSVYGDGNRLVSVRPSKVWSVFSVELKV